MLFGGGGPGSCGSPALRLCLTLPVDRCAGLLHTKVMTTTRPKQFVTDLRIEVLTDPGVLDWDEREDQAEEFTDEVATVVDGAVRAALNAIIERFPSYGVVLTVDGEEV